MRRFKLIKEYPGSGNIGAIHLGCNSYEEYPEFYEEILEVNFMVSLTDMPFHNAWEPMRVEAIKYDTDTKKYFSTEEGAKSFIILHKPCLSYNDVKEEMRCQVSQQGILQSIYHIVKSRI